MRPKRTSPSVRSPGSPWRNSFLGGRLRPSVLPLIVMAVWSVLFGTENGISMPNSSAAEWPGCSAAMPPGWNTSGSRPQPALPGAGCGAIRIPCRHGSGDRESVRNRLGYMPGRGRRGPCRRSGACTFLNNFPNSSPTSGMWRLSTGGAGRPLIQGVSFKTHDDRSKRALICSAQTLNSIVSFSRPMTTIVPISPARTRSNL